MPCPRIDSAGFCHIDVPSADDLLHQCRLARSSCTTEEVPGRSRHTCTQTHRHSDCNVTLVIFSERGKYGRKLSTSSAYRRRLEVALVKASVEVQRSLATCARHTCAGVRLATSSNHGNMARAVSNSFPPMHPMLSAETCPSKPLFISFQSRVFSA